MAGRPRRWTDEDIEQLAVDLVHWMKEDPDRVWFKSWAIERGIPPEYLSRWAARNEVFRQAMALSEAWQEERVFTGALYGKYNSRIAALCLETKHHWSKTQNINVSQGDEDGHTLAERLHELIPEDTDDARRWLQMLADGQGDSAEAKALQAGAGHQLRLLDMELMIEEIEEETNADPHAFEGSLLPPSPRSP